MRVRTPALLHYHATGDADYGQHLPLVLPPTTHAVINTHEKKDTVPTRFLTLPPRRRVLLALATGRRVATRHSAGLHATAHQSALCCTTSLSLCGSALWVVLCGEHGIPCYASVACVGFGAPSTLRSDGFGDASVTRLSAALRSALTLLALPHTAVVPVIPETSSPRTLLRSPYQHPQAPTQSLRPRRCVTSFCSVASFCCVVFRPLHSVSLPTMPSADSQHTLPCCSASLRQSAHASLSQAFRVCLRSA